MLHFLFSSVSVIILVLEYHLVLSQHIGGVTPFLKGFISGGGDVRSFIDSMRRRIPSPEVSALYQSLIDQMDPLDVATLLAWVRTAKYTEPGLRQSVKDSLAIDSSKYVIAFTRLPQLCKWLYGNFTATAFATSSTKVTEHEYFDTTDSIRDSQKAYVEYENWKRKIALTPTPAPVITPKGQRKPRPAAPELPPLFTSQSTLYEQAICPRFVGLEDGTNMKYGLGYRRQYHGHISRDRLILVNLMDVVNLEKYCGNTVDLALVRKTTGMGKKEKPGIFQNCFGPLQTLKLFPSVDRFDMDGWKMSREIHMTENQNKSHPVMSRPFAPHLVAIKDAFLSWWGYIFDFHRWYLHGGCSDKSYYGPTFEYDMYSQPVMHFNEPVLSLVHPFPAMFYHEFIELHAMLVMSLPILEAMPNITIIVNKHMVHKQIFPLLRVTGIHPEKLNFIAMKGDNSQARRHSDASFANNAVIRAPYIITPISLWCQYLSRGVTKTLQKGYARLPFWGEPGDGIVIIDRYNLRPKRFLVQGGEMLSLLQAKYGHMRSVKMYHGNETLEETVRIFRGAKVLIAAHGGGESNMLFMPSGGVVIEVRPDNWPMPCFIDLADNVGLQIRHIHGFLTTTTSLSYTSTYPLTFNLHSLPHQHYLVVTTPNREKGATKCLPDKHPEMCVDMNWFMPKIYAIINELDQRHL